jgi:hypothetical protein
VYDIGLNEPQRQALESSGVLKLRRLPEQRPALPRHVYNIGSRAWKPVVIAELLKEATTVVWTEGTISIIMASIRHKNNQFRLPVSCILAENVILGALDSIITSAHQNGLFITGNGPMLDWVHPKVLTLLN